MADPKNNAVVPTPWYLSRANWLSMLSAAVLIGQAVTGKQLNITLEDQTIVLAVINMIVHAVTHKDIIADKLSGL